jgi:hypothetical protein
MLDEVVNPQTPRKYTVLDGNFVFIFHDFDLCDFFRNINPGLKRDLPVLPNPFQFIFNIIPHSTLQLVEFSLNKYS